MIVKLEPFPLFDRSDRSQLTPGTMARSLCTDARSQMRRSWPPDLVPVPTKIIGKTVLYKAKEPLNKSSGRPSPALLIMHEAALSGTHLFPELLRAAVVHRTCSEDSF